MATTIKTTMTIARIAIKLLSESDNGGGFHPMISPLEATMGVHCFDATAAAAALPLPDCTVGIPDGAVAGGGGGGMLLLPLFDVDAVVDP